MRALTVWPEWAWAIRWLGKDVENRYWLPPMHPGDELAIHAGRNPGGTGRRAEALRSLEGVAYMAQRAGWEVRARADGGDVELWFRRTPPGAGAPVERVLRAGDLVRGAVVAAAVLGSYLDPGAALSPWADPQQQQWPLCEMRPVPAPVPCRGYQRIWYLPPDVEDAVRGQLEGNHG